MFYKSGFKDFNERQQFIKSGLGQFLINAQVEQLNSITAGDKTKISSFIKTFVAYLNNLMFVDEKRFVVLKFDDLNPNVYEDACYGAYEDIDGVPTITIDERFKFLTDYVKYPHLNKIQFNDEIVSTDDQMLFFLLITTLHEFEHYNQDVLGHYIDSSRKNAKDAFNEFSPLAIKATLSTYKLDLEIEKDMPSEILKTMAKLTGVSTFNFIKENMDFIPTCDEEVYDEIIDLVEKIESFEYKESLFEVDARFTSYITVKKLMQMYLNHPNISEDSKKFLNYFSEFMNDNHNITQKLELLNNYNMFFAFLKQLKSIDNEKLFKHICQYKYPYPDESNTKDYQRKNKLTNKFAYFLSKKGFETIKDFFEYVVTQSPNDFSFWVADVALRASQNFQSTQKEIFDTYYRYLKKAYSQNSLKAEQISFLFLSDTQKSNLLTLFLKNKQWTFACKIMEDIDFKKYSRENIEILKQNKEEFLNFVKKHKYHDILIVYATIINGINNKEFPNKINTKIK